VRIELELLARVSFRGREITSGRLRGLLALLAEDLKAGAGTGRLVASLWPDEQPENPAKALQILVSRARGQLGPDVIVTTPTGYRLGLDAEQVDASAVLASGSASARSSRAGDHLSALAHAEAGLALWQGSEGGSGPDDLVSALRVRREPTRRSLIRARALALSRLGRHGEAIEELTRLAQQRPRDEEILLELLRSEAGTLGPAAALARFEEYRKTLREELGTDPGSALQALHRELLGGAAPPVRRGIPHEPNPLLGRDNDIRAVANLLRVSRVTTILGPGGLGKTRLAYAVSRDAEQRVVHVVSLAGVSTDEGVAPEVASALGVGEARRTPTGHPVLAQDLLAGIASELSPASALLVLDNCEHVIRGAAELVHALVSLTKDVRVLTTSRAPLGLSSESVYPLPELELPATVELFIQRATAARPGVDLPTEAVTELCRHLDGLPLAVELAAARVRALSVGEIAERLRDRFALLRGGSRDAPERHRTLRAVVEWSWNLLDPGGQAAMRALSVFPGGFTVDAAERVTGDGDIVEHLVDQSLLKVTDTPVGTRFHMLETVREFSVARREEAGETELVTSAFLAWATEFGIAQHGAPVGTEPFQGVRRIRAEQDNLIQALRLGLARADGPAVAATAAVLGGLWMVESNVARMVALVEDTAAVLPRFRPEPELVEVTRAALALTLSFGFVAYGPHASRSLVALRRLPEVATVDDLGQAVAVVLAAAPRDVRALLALADSEQPMVAGVASSFASYVWERQGDLARARKATERTLEMAERSQLPWPVALAHARLAELCLQADEPVQAREHVAAALAFYEELDVPSEAIGLRTWMVFTNLQAGAIDEAERWLELAVPDRDAHVIERTYGFGVRAEILFARGEIEPGLRLWRRAVDDLRGADHELGLETWILEAHAATLAAHARYGRLEAVKELAGSVTETLVELLEHPTEKPPPYLMELPITGALLLAEGVAELDQGATGSGVRLIALAERFGFLRNFQPTMSPALARQAAEDADRSAYADAVSSYADLGHDDLRAAALAVLSERG
jgi:predicted ATPase/DNA-binding SARP family transcriptional activator